MPRPEVSFQQGHRGEQRHLLALVQQAVVPRLELGAGRPVEHPLAELGARRELKNILQLSRLETFSCRTSGGL